MPRPVLTARDLEDIPDGGEIVATPDTLITALAREEVERRNIRLRIEEPVKGGSSSKFGRVVALGADHGGFALKEEFKGYLRDWGYVALDLGTSSTDSVDYPDFAEAVANAVVRGDAWRGVVIDSAGIGSSIAANKVPGARAALCYDRATARNSREHNDANILSLGARLIAAEVAREILAVWLQTEFGGGRHQKRIDKIRAIEERYRKP
ncbi:MAG: ribose 5-phosphate isomerase B [Candidatus Acidiferrales bacterium]